MKLSLQQIFDIGVAGIRSQNYARSEHPKTRGCMYNHPDGVRHCAYGYVFKHVGWDDEKVNGYEGKPIDWIKEFQLELDDETKDINSDVFYQFQALHDDLGPLPEKNKNFFESRAEQFAKDYDLVYTAPSN